MARAAGYTVFSIQRLSAATMGQFVSMGGSTATLSLPPRLKEAKKPSVFQRFLPKLQRTETIAGYRSNYLTVRIWFTWKRAACSMALRRRGSSMRS